MYLVYFLKAFFIALCFVLLFALSFSRTYFYLLSAADRRIVIGRSCTGKLKLMIRKLALVRIYIYMTNLNSAVGNATRLLFGRPRNPR